MNSVPNATAPRVFEPDYLDALDELATLVETHDGQENDYLSESLSRWSHQVLKLATIQDEDLLSKEASKIAITFKEIFVDPIYNKPLTQPLLDRRTGFYTLKGHKIPYRSWTWEASVLKEYQHYYSMGAPTDRMLFPSPFDGKIIETVEHPFAKAIMVWRDTFFPTEETYVMKEVVSEPEDSSSESETSSVDRDSSLDLISQDPSEEGAITSQTQAHMRVHLYRQILNQFDRLAARAAQIEEANSITRSLESAKELFEKAEKKFDQRCKAAEETLNANIERCETTVRTSVAELTESRNREVSILKTENTQVRTDLNETRDVVKQQIAEAEARNKELEALQKSNANLASQVHQLRNDVHKGSGGGLFSGVVKFLKKLF